MIQINDLKRDPSSNVVVSVQWDIVVHDQGSMISQSFVHDLPPKDPSDASFVNYADLSEDLVEQWVIDLVGQEFISEQEQKMLNRIAECQSVNVESGTPWVRQEDIDD